MRTAQKRLPEEGLAIQPELHRNSGRITRQFSLNHNAIQHELQRGGEAEDAVGICMVDVLPLNLIDFSEELVRMYAGFRIFAVRNL